MRTVASGVRRLGAVVVLALLSPAVVACDDGTSTRPPDGGFDYVAIGDSYTAAPGLPGSSTDGCLRSDRNYPHLVADRLEDVTLVDVSCGGARTDAVLGSQVQESEGRVHPPQIDAVSEDTDLVTVGLGVNDLGFVVTAGLECLLLAERDPGGSPCADANTTRVDRALSTIRARLVDTLDAIAHRAPEARIILVGYPRLFPETGGCPRLLPLAEGDVAFVRQSYDRFNASLESAADEAGVDFLDVAAASAGHDICSDEPWVNGQDAKKNQGAAYHPTPAGQKAVAGLLLDALESD